MAWLTLERDRASCLLHNRLADGEPKAGTACVPAARRIASREALEDMRQEFGLNAIAVVFDTQLDRVYVCVQQHFDLGPRRTVLQRIQQQVGAQQATFLAREGNEGGLVCSKRECDPAELRHGLKVLRGRRDRCGEICSASGML